MSTMDIKQPVQKIIAWSKENPLIAGGLVAGAVALGYVASKNMDKMTLVSDNVVDDAAGAGIMSGEDELTPLVPYVDFDPVSGIPLLPTSNGTSNDGRSDDDGGDDPVYTWIPDEFKTVVTSPLDSSYDVQAIQSLRSVTSPLDSSYDVQAIQSLHDLSNLFTAPAQTTPPDVDTRLDRIVMQEPGVWATPVVAPISTIPSSQAVVGTGVQEF